MSHDQSTERFCLPPKPGDNFLDVDFYNGYSKAQEDTGSVHNIAFSLSNDAALLPAQEALIRLGYAVATFKDLTYFKAINFRIPSGILFEVATDSSGFVIGEPVSHLEKHFDCQINPNSCVLN